jgi:hypothetical protein
MKDRLSRAESLLAAILSTAAIAHHFLAAISAGALWRDEANTVGLATLPRISDVWANLESDSFPVGWILFVRFLAFTAGAMNDTAFRITGLLIGLTLLAMLWINARAFKYGAPLMSLALIALNPSVIRWGDSLRAYGAGMAFAVLIGVMIWRFVEQSTGKRFLHAALAAILGVQVLYYNAPVVLSFCAAGACVAISRRDYRLVARVIAIGALAALSLLIYFPVIRAAATWNSLVTIPTYDFSWFAFKLDEAISPAGGFATATWVFVTLTAAWLCVRQVVLKPSALSDRERDKVVFAFAALLAIAMSHYAFLKTLSYLTQPWYYLTLLVVIGITVDMIFGVLMTSRALRIGRVVLAAGIGAMTVFPAMNYVGMRMTNVDRIARAIGRKPRSGDVVLLAPWYLGVSFSRYYRGDAQLITVPEVPFHGYHRYDFIAAEMQRKDQARAVSGIVDGLRSALTSGRTVFLVSDGRVWIQERPVILLPPAEIPRDGWKSPLYQKEWSALVGAELRDHAVSISPQILQTPTRVGGFENLYLTIVRGWR